MKAPGALVFFFFLKNFSRIYSTWYFARNKTIHRHYGAHMSFKVISESGSEWGAFEIRISKDGSSGSPISLYVISDRADFEAKRLSEAMPEYTVTLAVFSRLKAVYKNGERTRVFDFLEFYSNLTESEYASTKIQDADTAEWI